MARDPFEDRWGHFRELMEQLLIDPERARWQDEVVWYPATDAVETESAFVVRMEVAGVHRDSLAVELNQTTILVRGVRGDATPTGTQRYHTMEIARGPFVRAVRAPDRFRGAKAQASYHDGILEIVLTPRARGRAVVLQITID